MNSRQLTAQGLERKEQLLGASARLFAEQGYAATRIADIVKEAGVAKGLFYWYFENKEALYVAVLERMLAFAPGRDDPTVAPEHVAGWAEHRRSLVQRIAAQKGRRSSGPPARSVLSPRARRPRSA